MEQICTKAFWILGGGWTTRDSDDGQGKVKGNCDADLVLQAARDFYEHHFDQALLVSSDGDYASLAKFLHGNNKLQAILSPSNRCSILLKRTNAPMAYLSEQKAILRTLK